MTRPFGDDSDDELRLHEAELKRFNTYYSKYVKIGSAPLSLEEAELVLQLMAVEQRWAIIAAIKQQR